jgi:predicted AlkP superfamily phosphohydrolase/phosphomutase
MEKGKVFVFGMDGATFDIIKPAVKKGKLPNIASLMERGSYGCLESTVPPITPMAWSSFATGVNAGKHGIFDFSRYEKGQVRLNTAKDRKAPAIWSFLTKKSRPCVVVNVPFTYPPEQISGIMIPGFDTPKVEKEVFFPESLYDELTDEFGEYLLDWTFPIGMSFAPHTYIKKIEQVVQHRGDTGLYLMKNKPWDFFMTVFTSTDHVQHVFWNYPGGRKYIEKVYEAVDLQLGRFLEALDSETSVFIMSDHGAGEIKRILYLDNWLAQEGYLKRPGLGIKGSVIKNIKTNLKRILPVKMRKTLRSNFSGMKNRMEGVLHESTVDWSETKAFSTGMYGNINVNLKGREPWGTVEPDDYEKIIKEISRKLMNIIDPETGKKIVHKIYKKEELYSGPLTKNAPDIIIHWKDYACFTKKGIDRGKEIFGDILMIDSSEYPHTGTHRLEGVFIGAGPQIKHEQDISAHITDIAPTILGMMGEELPENMDGRFLQQIFKSVVTPLKSQTEEGETEAYLKDELSLTKDEEASVKDRLKSLGYI